MDARVSDRVVSLYPSVAIPLPVPTGTLTVWVAERSVKYHYMIIDYHYVVSKRHVIQLY